MFMIFKEMLQVFYNKYRGVWHISSWVMIDIDYDVIKKELRLRN